MGEGYMINIVTWGYRGDGGK